MQNSFLATFLLLSPITTYFYASERLVTYDNSVKEFYQRDHLNNLYVAWLIKEQGALAEPKRLMPAYGVINGATRVPNNAAYAIFTTFPLEMPEQVACFIDDTGAIKHEGVLKNGAKRDILQRMHTLLLNKPGYDNRTHQYDPKRTDQELITVHPLSKHKRLQLNVSLANNSGKEHLQVTELEVRKNSCDLAAFPDNAKDS